MKNDSKIRSTTTKKEQETLNILHLNKRNLKLI